MTPKIKIWRSYDYYPSGYPIGWMWHAKLKGPDYYFWVEGADWRTVLGHALATIPAKWQRTVEGRR